ncbi:MAG: hypothetical protein ACXWXX_17835 [Candidatus Binatia bacterium]
MERMSARASSENSTPDTMPSTPAKTFSASVTAAMLFDHYPLARRRIEQLAKPVLGFT